MSSYGYTIFELCRSALQTHLLGIKIQFSGAHNAKHARRGPKSVASRGAASRVASRRASVYKGSESNDPSSAIAGAED